MCKRCFVPPQGSVCVGGKTWVFTGEEPVYLALLKETDSFEAECLCDKFIDRFPVSSKSLQISKPPLSVLGVSEDFVAFNEAITLLSQVDPMRMKTIQQLEGRYHSAVVQLKARQRSALTSLQTRQALEVDMLTNSSAFTKSELAGLVAQHVSELDELSSHWNTQVETLLAVQLSEYRELVMEVAASSQSCPPTELQYTFVRPEFGIWSGFEAVAVRTSSFAPARLVRLITVKGGIFESALRPRKLIDGLDPEEQCLEEVRACVSAVVLGRNPKKQSVSCQDAALVRLLDSDAPTECRWPSFAAQWAELTDDLIYETRHSNLAFGVCVIFHVPNSGFDNVLKLADERGIQRLIVPHVLVPDLLAPALSDDAGASGLLKAAIRRNLTNQPKHSKGGFLGSLKEVVLIRP